MSKDEINIAFIAENLIVLVWLGITDLFLAAWLGKPETFIQNILWLVFNILLAYPYLWLAKRLVRLALHKND